MHGNRHTSHWWDGARPRHFPALEGTREVDVVVVGGGITGLTAALLLKQAGQSVAVVEARRLGSGATGGTSAHLTAMPDHGFHTIESKFDANAVRQVWGTGLSAIERIESICRELGIDAEFARIPGYQLDGEGDDHAWFDRELTAARRCHVPFHLEQTGLPLRASRGMRFDGQARFHPLKYLAGLADALSHGNSLVFEDSRVLAIQPGEPCVVTTSGGSLRAAHVLLATHTPIGAVVSVQTRMTAYRSYCLAMRLAHDFPDALLWNSREPYDYVRRHGDHLIVGGRDHRTGEGRDLADRWTELEAWARANLPVGEVTHRWSANLYEPADGLPYIGAMPGTPNVLMATGFSGTGLTNGTAAAILLTDLVLGRDNPWAQLYAPSRLKPIASAGRMVEENLGSAWHFVKDRLTPAEARSLADVPEGEGRIVRVQGKKMACYREPGGEVHVLSAVCSHLGCMVRWNDAEASWDCACHGSRFEAKGEVLDGPAVRGLGSTEPGARVYETPGEQEAQGGQKGEEPEAEEV